MKCPECQKHGLKSCVYGGDIGMSTLMYCAPYYDEKGIYHRHDTNTTTYQMRCSNGHEWAESHQSKCPAPNCDWNKT